MIDESSLFLHVLAAMGMVGGGIVQVLAGFQVRTAPTGRSLAQWAGFTRQSGLLIAASAFLSLMTGGHLAGAVWTTEATSGFSYPFITVGAAGLLLLAPIGPMIGGAKLRRLTEEAKEVAEAPTPPELLEQARAASLWGPVHSLLGVGVGFVALMTYKPGGWVTAVLLLLVTFALGWLAGILATRTPA